jgi:hypothetical protein
LLAAAVADGSDAALDEYQRTRDALAGDVFDVTDEIAGYEWSLERVRELHHELSRGMAHEVAHLSGLTGEAVAAG